VNKKRRDDLVKTISKLVETLSSEEKKEILESILGIKEGIPISIFRSNLSGLGAISVYLKDVKEQKIGDIASLLNRKKSTIYTTYRKAKEKLKGEFDLSDNSIVVPLEIFTNRKFSILESLVFYLKDEHKFSFVKIAKILGKNYSTVRTVHTRYQKKCR
jgi:hypothetical protein